MQRFAGVFILISLIYLPAEAQKLRWPEVRNKQLVTFDWNCSQTELFPKKSLSKIVQRAIPPDDRERPGTWGDRAFTAKLLKGGSTIYFVPTVCGATGNCTWRLYSVDPVKYLGEVGGQYLYIYRSPMIWPTIITYTHMSASEGILATYRFRSDKYRWLGDEYPVYYEEWKGNQMPKFLQKAKIMCKGYGRS